MRSCILLATGLLLLGANASYAQAPRREQRFTDETKPASSLQQDLQPPTINLVVGGLAGGAVGLFAFGFAGALIADSQARDGGDGYEALGGFVLGAVVGESVILPLGVHIANRRQGDYALSLLASAGIAAVGVGLTAAMEDMAIVFLPAIPIAQLITSITIERKTID